MPVTGVDEDSAAAVLREEAPLVGSRARSDDADDDGKTAGSGRVPPAVYVIIVNEICERFSFYALKSVLALYLQQRLGFSEDHATASLSGFIFAAYTCTLGGGYLADAHWGKYRTIVVLSLVYCVGGALLAITAIPGTTGDPPHWWGAALSLFLIAVGTGGIKPCVSAFLGDQFSASQEHMLQRLFMYFYFSINLGSVFSTLLTPVIRSHWSYAAAFALPAVLLFISVLIFVSGRSYYRRVPPAGSIVSRSFGAVFLAAYRSAVVFFNRSNRHSQAPVAHWLERARPRYSATLVGELRIALRTVSIFGPVVICWALFDQNSSRWVFQATRMNRNFFGYELEPDQLPFLNPLLVLLLIPTMDNVIYPGLARCGIKLAPLRRIAIGMFLTSMAFCASAVVEEAINVNGADKVHVAFQLPQFLLLTTGEVMFSITGLEFAYTQSPTSLKSVVGALWQLTVAGGNLIVMLVATTSLLEQFYEYLLFAFLMLLALGLFLWIAKGYQYREDHQKAEVTSDELDSGDDEPSASKQGIDRV